MYPSPNKSVAFIRWWRTNIFGEYLAAHHMTQARIAETFRKIRPCHLLFFNGGVEAPNEGGGPDPGKIP